MNNKAKRTRMTNSFALIAENQFADVLCSRYLAKYFKSLFSTALVICGIFASLFSRKYFYCLDPIYYYRMSKESNLMYYVCVIFNPKRTIAFKLYIGKLTAFSLSRKPFRNQQCT